MRSRALGTLVKLICLGVLLAIIVWPNLRIPRELRRLESIERLLELDLRLLWRQRSGLDTLFEGTRVCTDASGFRIECEATAHQNTDAERVRVVTLGASPTFGYGVEASQTYPLVAESLLRERRPGLQVVNAGQIGYSSWQGLRLFERHGASWSPNLVTVSYMVNDIDRYRFFLSNGLDDAHTSEPAARKARISNALARFSPTAALSRFQRRLLLKLRGSVDYRARYELAAVRVSPVDYRDNLVKFTDICRERGIRLVFVEMPFRLPESLPEPDPQVPALLEQAQVRLERGEAQPALELAQQALERDPRSSRGHYAQGRALELLGQGDQARDAYRAAVEHVIYDCARDGRVYNRIMEELAAERSIPLVNAASCLGAESADMGLFIPHDYIHPNAQGHALVGRLLATALERALEPGSGWFVEKCE